MTVSRGVRSSTVVIAVTLQRLIEDATRFWTFEEQMVLDALRRSSTRLNDASMLELAETVKDLSGHELQGFLSNVKGIYHELLFVHAENTDGDEVTARVFERTNHPGADVEFVVDGEVIREVQLKAVAAPSAIIEHFRRYPDIDVVATSEVAAGITHVESSGFSNASISGDVEDGVDELQGDGFAEEIGDGIASSVLVSAAFIAGQAVRERRFSRAELRTALGDVAVGSVAALVLDVLISGGA